MDEDEHLRLKRWFDKFSFDNQERFRHQECYTVFPYSLVSIYKLPAIAITRLNENRDFCTQEALVDRTVALASEARKSSLQRQALDQMTDQIEEIALLQRHKTNLEDQLKPFGDLPSDITAAEAKVRRADQRLAKVDKKLKKAIGIDMWS